jgi:hypothetical protein
MYSISIAISQINMKTAIFLSVAIISFFACETGRSGTEPNTAEVNSASRQTEMPSAGGSNETNSEAGEIASAPQVVPKNVREFFMLLPEKYFTLEGCERDKDKDCRRAREEYLKEFAEVDLANGYIKGGCDGGQACIEMAIFKRPDNTYLVGVSTFAEMMNDYYFLDYNGGKWKDVSAEVVPQFSKKNMYELPRNGTTVQVYAKKIIEQGPDFEASEKGKQLYDLVWKDGKFAVKK